MTLPAFHVEAGFVYLRNDLQGAPLSLLGELSQLVGKHGSIRTDTPKTGAPPMPGYRPWAVVTRPLLIVEGDFVYLCDGVSAIDPDVFATLAKTIGNRHVRGGDKSGAPELPGYRVFMALAPVKDP